VFPFIDLDSGGSVQGLIAGVEKVLEEIPEDVKIIPGHGALATKGDLRTYLAMLKETSGAVSSAIEQKKTLDQMKQEKVLIKWEAFGKGFIKTEVFTEILYRSLTSKREGPKNDHGHSR
jgi:hypothetical protein